MAAAVELAGDLGRPGPARHRPHRRPRRPARAHPVDPVAHHPHHRHPPRRRRGPLHRRLGPARQRRAHPEPPRDRRAVRGRRRRVVDHAAQGEPGALGAGTPRRAGRAAARGHPAPGRRRVARRARRRRLARRVGDAAHAAPPDGGRRVPDQRAAGRAQGARRPDGDPPGRRARRRTGGAAEHGRPGRHLRPAATTSAPRTRSSRRRWRGPPAYSRRGHDDQTHDHRRPADRRPQPGRAAAAGARPVDRHLGHHALDRLRRPDSPTPSTWSAWDLPGHGHNRAVPEEPFTMAELAAGVLEVVDTLLAERDDLGGSFSYAGDSVGGAVGLQLLLDVPDRVVGAVLLCTGAQIGTPEMWAGRMGQVSVSGTPVLVSRLRRALVRPRLPRARAGARAPRCCTRCRTPTTTGYVQVCRALRRVRRARAARRDRRTGAGRSGRRGRRDADRRSCARSRTA